MDERQADDLLDNLVSYIGARFGLIPRELPHWEDYERRRVDKLRADIIAALRGDPPPPSEGL